MKIFQNPFILFLISIPILITPALADNTVGIYWDPAYTQDSILTDTFPSIHTGYLVLMDSVGTHGVTSWECCVGIEGPAIFLSWVLEGQTLNLETPPCFQVGISPDPLPVPGPVLLATFMTMVSEDLPVTYSVEPLLLGTLPGRMSFTTSDDPQSPRPMDPVTGTPEVAWINNDVPLLEIDREHIQFADTFVGYPKTEILTISNLGYVDASLEATLSDTSGVFLLTGPPNPVIVPARGFVELEITFDPPDGELHTCTLDLGDQLPEVFLSGSGNDGHLSWQMVNLIDYGDLELGRTTWRHLLVTNTGDVAFPIYPSLPESCTEFTFNWGPDPTMLPPGETLDLHVSFRPSEVGFYTCELSMGEILPDVTLTGTCFIPDYDWVAPAELMLGPVEVGSFHETAFQVHNTGLLPFTVSPSLPDTCSGFSIVQGSGDTLLDPGSSVEIRLRYTPEAPGVFTCSLNLGNVVPPVSLVGFDSNPSWTAPTEMTLGPVGLGLSVEKSFQIRNTGNVPFIVHPTFPQPCDEFSIESESGETELLPGTYMYVRIRFEPAVLGNVYCTLDLGEVVPPVALTGIGRDPQLLWTCPPSLDIGDVATGETGDAFLYVWNTGDIPFPLEVALADSCPEFEITNGAGSHMLDPGRSRRVDIDFTPSVLGPDSCTLDMGLVVPPVLLTARGVEPAEGWTVTPPVFDLTGVGEIDEGWVRVSNTGNTTIVAYPYFDTPCNHFVTGVTQRTILPGESGFIWIDFRPTLPGSLSCVLDLGPVLPDVVLEGEAFSRPEGWNIDPGSLDFPLVFVGQSEYSVVEFNNTGGTFLSLDVGLDPPNPHFSIAVGGGQYQVAPGYSRGISIHYTPLAAGSDTTALVFGPGFPSVPVTGLSQDVVFDCLVQPDTLYFPAQTLGQSTTLPYSITNTGNQTLDLSLLLESDHFTTESGDQELDPGEMFNGIVTFFPKATGDFEASLDFGNDACADLICLGTGWTDSQPDQNLVGMFFDPEFTTLAVHTFEAPEVVTGYLVLSNPTTDSGVAAWECAYDLNGNGQFLGWDFEGQALNAGNYNNLIVGIGGPPLPHAPQILLATFQVLVPGPGDIQELVLGPIQFPSIPGQMVWAPGGQPGTLLPMLPATGREIVAWINKDISTVGQELPGLSELRPNFPNPFNPSTRINFALAGPGEVRVAIYDVTGRKIVDLVDGFLEAGAHTRVWQGRDDRGRQVPSGSYIVRMVAGNRVDARKILLLK